MAPVPQSSPVQTIPTTSKTSLSGLTWACGTRSPLSPIIPRIINKSAALAARTRPDSVHPKSRSGTPRGFLLGQQRICNGKQKPQGALNEMSGFSSELQIHSGCWQIPPCSGLGGVEVVPIPSMSRQVAHTPLLPDSSDTQPEGSHVPGVYQNNPKHIADADVPDANVSKR